MIKKIVTTLGFCGVAFLFAVGCSSKSDKGSSGGNLDRNADISGAQSFFMVSGTGATQASINPSAMVSERDSDRDFDDDDDDRSVLYFSNANGVSQELYFSLNGVKNRAYIDDVVYAGENWLLVEIEGFATVADDGTLTGRFNEQERNALINIVDGSIKELPIAQMGDCRDRGDDSGELDIELFEVVGGNGYAFCEDAAFKIDMASMTATGIGSVGYDQFDDSAVVVFADGTVLAVNGATANSNSSIFLNNTTVPTVTFDDPIKYTFLQVSSLFPITLDANGISGTYQNLVELNNALANKATMGSYYHDQLKFLFGDVRYERDDGKYEMTLLNQYTRKANDIYKFINFKDKTGKIYTLSLEDNFTVTPSVQNVVLAEISADTNGKIVRNIVSVGATPSASGFSGVLVNRRDSTSRHLDVQHAFDNTNFYTIDMSTKTVTSATWAVAAADINAMKAVTRGSVYYGAEGIAFISGGQVKHVKYEANAAAIAVPFPNGVSCSPNNVSLDGSIVYYTCGRSDTYMVDMDSATPVASPAPAQGKVIGNIIEVKNKRR